MRWTAVLLVPEPTGTGVLESVGVLETLVKWFRRVEIDGSLARKLAEPEGTGVSGLLRGLGRKGEGEVVICRSVPHPTETLPYERVLRGIEAELREEFEVRSLIVGRGPDAVWNVSDLVVEALWSSDLVYVDVSGARGPEIAGIPLGLAALEVPGLSVGGGREVRFVAGRLEDDVLADVTEHFGAAGALIWTIICSWKPSPEAARRAIELAECAGADVRELDWLGEYVDALDTAQVGEVLARARSDRKTIRTIVRILRRMYATDG